MRWSKCLHWLAASACLAFNLTSMAQTPAADPYLWLEDVTADKALDWVRARNAKSQSELQAVPSFEPSRRNILSVLNNREQIPGVGYRGGWFYNFWRDAQHPKGLWRRTTLAQYRKAEPQWDVLLDLDALAQKDQESWVWAGAHCLAPAYQRCLVQLSRGGSDAHVTREFDLSTRSFVGAGFELPEAKSEVRWIDADTIYVATDFGPDSLTQSGYPRLIKAWKRGTPLASAKLVFEGQSSDVEVNVQVDLEPGFERTVFTRTVDFFHNEQFWLNASGRLEKINKPGDATLQWQREWAFLELKSPLTVGSTVYPQGALVATRFANLTRANPGAYELLFSPTATRFLADGELTQTRDALILNIQDNVASRLEEVRRVGDQWVHRAIDTPFPGALSTSSLYDPFAPKDPLANAYLLTYTDFLTPTSLYLGQLGQDQRELLKHNPQYFDASGMRVEQRFARSKDGTPVPYFVVFPKNAKPGGGNPTLLYGYGGFQVSLQPWYSGVWGGSWLARGGTFVVANIRGGGEFGPGWHQSAIKANKQRSYDDFAAVAEDLIRTGVSQPEHLGIMGGSNGGLLVGAVMLQRPELFGAVVCSVPLLDMQRFHLLLAGNSWMAEYGNPDLPDEWAFISRYSPYQNVKKGVKYPKVLFTTSTRDDRVHPGHARKMAARMLEQGHDVLYYENIEGGHGGAADNTQRAHLMAMELAFMWSRLGGS